MSGGDGGRIASRIDLRGPAIYEAGSGRRIRAYSLAAFFAAGALVSGLVVVVPGWPQMHRPGLAVTIAVAAAGALVLWRFADRIDRVLCHGFVVLGSVLIGICQVLPGGGSASTAYAMLYVWVILHAALFFSSRAVAGHLGIATAAHVTALLIHAEHEAVLPQLVLTMGTQVAAWIVVATLSRRLHHVARTDHLTGVANRREAEFVVHAAVDRARRRGEPLCVSVLDLDGFKEFNDGNGHPAGDELLVDAARAWRGELPRTATLARTGGDEFLAVLPGCDPTQAAGIARRLVEATPRGVGCSAGVVSWDGAEGPDTLLRRADVVLYQAKAGDEAVAVASTRTH